VILFFPVKTQDCHLPSLPLGWNQHLAFFLPLQTLYQLDFCFPGSSRRLYRTFDSFFRPFSMISRRSFFSWQLLPLFGGAAVCTRRKVILLPSKAISTVAVGVRFCFPPFLSLLPHAQDLYLFPPFVFPFWRQTMNSPLPVPIPDGHIFSKSDYAGLRS